MDLTFPTTWECGIRILIWSRRTLSMPFYRPFFVLGSSIKYPSVASATPMVFRYLLVQRASQSSVICWICPQTNHGLSIMNGRKPMVNFSRNHISYKHPHCSLSLLAGDMVYFEVLGQPFLVLDTHERTSDLFDKRSTNYSDRMRIPMLLEL